ncbi:MAG TPA: mycothiol system anti-sigma-R factor [Candidatus Lumbricidophila sp.]|nr:mycothiol system anti-sigma-R factor [Candidatus Lumbricidophila sp.]
MTDCGCEKARAELEELLHDELCREDAAVLREHIEGCDGCAGEYHIGQVISEVVQRACKEAAPADLRSQVLARLREMQTAP